MHFVCISHFACFFAKREGEMKTREKHVVLARRERKTREREKHPVLAKRERLERGRYQQNAKI